VDLIGIVPAGEGQRDRLFVAHASNEGDLGKVRSSITILTETRVGYVTYEDELQNVAEPFSDTKTGRG
jgi:hypothetical protein